MTPWPGIANLRLLVCDSFIGGTVLIIRRTNDPHPETDTLSGIDRLMFNDMTIEINQAPDAVGDDDLAANEVSENAANGDVVGITALTADPDGDTITYSLADNAGGRFAIDASTGVVTVANASLLNYETATSHAIVLKASDGSRSTTSTVTIAIVDGNDPPAVPTDVNAAANSVGENAGTGTTVGITASASDPDPGDWVNYSLADDAGGRFAIDADTGVVTVADGSLIDFETGASHSIVVRASDSGSPSLTSQQTFTIAVTNVVEAQTHTGGAGNDVFVAPSPDNWTLEGLDGNDTLTGNALADTLTGGTGDDTLTGGGGDDVFVMGGAGDTSFDAVDGGTGIDVIHPGEDGAAIGLKSLSGIEEISSPGPLGLSIVGDATANVFSFTGTTLVGVTLIDGGDGNDTILGSAANDTMAGGSGNDTLTGGVGEDVLDGGTGSDSLAGGLGNDIYYVDTIADIVTEAVSAGTDTVHSTVSTFTLPVNVENLIYDGSGTFVGTGNIVANLIQGGSGDDTLIGGAGADTLDGGDGLDTAAYTAAVTINLATGVHTGEAAGDQFTSIEIIAGSGLADTLTGDAGANWFQGGAGNDVLNGGDGADTLDGGAGTDTASFAGRVAGLTVDLSSGWTDDGDTLIGIENVTGSSYGDALTGDAGVNVLDGGVGDDILDGGAGTDTLTGGAGNDTLTGGAGTDSLTGGAGNDTYVVDVSADVVTEAIGEGTDTVRTALAAYTLPTNVENLAYDGAGAFVGTGNTVANVIQGGSGDDTLIGGAGADTLDGGDGLDTAAYIGAVTINLATGVHTGEATGDQFTGIEIIAGSGLADTLTGDAGANWFQGGAGNDILNGGDGADTLDGGAGADTASFAGRAAGVTVDLNSGWTDDGDTLIAIENVTGSSFADALTGDAGVNVLDGGAGDDILDGGAGTDTLTGGAGNDTLTGGAGTDTLTGGAGNDTYVVDVSADVVTEAASEGTDTIRTTLATYTLAANFENLAYDGAGAFVGIGNTVANLIQGGPGDDTLTGGAGADTLDGGGGLDIAAYTTAVTINLATGVHTGDALGDQFTGIEIIAGSGLADTLTGDAGDNWFQGGAGNDILNGGDGGDVLDGGAGTDTASFAGRATGLTADLSSGWTDDWDVMVAIENLTGSSFADTLTGDAGVNTLDGGAGDDILDGGDGNDTLTGGTGNDTLTGGAGTDRLSGGAGNDTYIVDISADVVTEAANEGTDTIRTALAAYTLPTNVENLAFDGAGTFVGTGNTQANLIQGGAGDDTLIGGAGADTLDGGDGLDFASYATAAAAVTVNLATGVHTGDALGDQFIGIEIITGSIYSDVLTGDAWNNGLFGDSGDDTLAGGAGADTLDGGSGLDYASYAGGTEGVTVDLGLGVASDGDFLISIERVTGSAWADVLIGDGGVNVLDGGAGDDTLTGGAGNDTLIGGTGNDTYFIDVSTDVVTEAGGGGTDTVHTTLAAYTAPGNVEGVVFDGTGNFAGTGNTLANLIRGGAGDDTLTGAAGADTLDGGAGIDTASYATATAAITINLATGVHTGDALGDQFIGIELIVGTPHIDTLTGDAGDNWFQGGASNDTLDGGAGADTLDGGAGIDTASYAGGAAVTVDLGTGGASDGDTLIGIENVTGSSFADALTGDGGVNALDGGAGDDILNGGAGNDNLTGGVGDDILDGGAGTDTLTGGAGNDTLTGGAGTDSLTGGAGNDTYVVDVSADVVTEAANEGTDTIRTTLATYTLAANFENLAYDGAGAFVGTGNTVVNLIQGGAGNDTLTGGAGADTLDGGGGIDTAAYTAAVTINLATGVNTGEALGDHFVSIEIIAGSALVDTLTGDAGDNWFQGGAGNDILAGGAGADTLDGGAGTDVVSYASAGGGVTVNLGAGTASDGDTLIGIENLTGSAYADVLTGDGGLNVLDGGTGDDTLAGGGGADTLIGGAGNDTYVIDTSGNVVTEASGAGTDIVRTTLATYTLPGNVENLAYAGAGNFVGAGNTLANVLQGGAGDDSLTGGAGADTLDGGAGFDFAAYTTAVTINLATGVYTGDAAGDQFIGIEVIAGSGFTDVLTGNAGDNWFQGSGGVDTLDGGAGADILDGGAGVDLVVYTGSGAGVTVDLPNLIGYGGDAEGDLLLGIENVTGSAWADALTGDGGVNILVGNAGDDTLDGGAGTDTLTGGTGNDTYYVDTSNDIVNELANEGIDTIHTTANSYGVSLNYAENLIYDGTGNFIGSGNALANLLQGGGGNDTLSGGAGADTLDGGAGIDVANYSSVTAAVGVTINLTTGVNTGGDAAGDQLINIEGVFGSIYADNLTGDAGVNTLQGGAGADTLTGGAGADRLDGGADSDTIVYTSAVTVNLATGANSEGDTLIGIENLTGSADADTLTGSAAVNIIIGGAGDDTIDGGGSNDTITGGAGRDVLHGDLGNDVFMFTADTDCGLGASADLINDFAVGQDIINLSGIDANTLLTGNQPFTFLGTSAFTRVAGQLRYAAPGDGYTHVYGDLNADGVADIEIALTGTYTLAAASFVL
jgi:Ca2+-binding RTX toxin-like protein